MNCKTSVKTQDLKQIRQNHSNLFINCRGKTSENIVNKLSHLWIFTIFSIKTRATHNNCHKASNPHTTLNHVPKLKNGQWCQLLHFPVLLLSLLLVIFPSAVGAYFQALPFALFPSWLCFFFRMLFNSDLRVCEF
jgi:hypothetical protein